jgi:hypothetical protein
MSKPMPQDVLTTFGCSCIHWNKNWNGGWFEYRYPIEYGSDGEPWVWISVRFDKDPRYGRDYMVYLMTDHYAVALKQIVTIEQFKAFVVC